MRVRVLIEMDDGGVGIRAVNVLDAAMRAYNEKLSRAVPDAVIDFDVLGIVPDAETSTGVVSEEPERDRAPCRSELWSWDYFSSEAVDPYWMHCHLIGKHDRHENSETGATWDGG